MEIQKKSSPSSSPSPPRRRHDSDSESDQSKPELKEKKDADKFKNLKRTYQEALGNFLFLSFLDVLLNKLLELKRLIAFKIRNNYSFI